MVTGPVEKPAVFGFSIRSEVPLQFLRHGGGSGVLEIVETPEREDVQRGDLLGLWNLKGTSYPARARLFRVPGGYEFETTDTGRFTIDLERGRIEVPVMADVMLREQRLHGAPMILSFLSRGDFSLHAAAVELGNGAVILGAPSRFGKTTLAYAFQQAGHRVLSEDLVCCRPSTCEVIPGPALLRLRPDVYQLNLPEGLFVAGERPDRYFVGFTPEKAGSGAPVPIRGIVFLREGDTIDVDEADPRIAIKDLWHLSFRLESFEDRADSFRSLTKLAGAVPMWRVTRPLTLEALAPTVEIVQRLATA